MYKQGEYAEPILGTLVRFTCFLKGNHEIYSQKSYLRLDIEALKSQSEEFGLHL